MLVTVTFLTSLIDTKFCEWHVDKVNDTFVNNEKINCTNRKKSPHVSHIA